MIEHRHSMPLLFVAPYLAQAVTACQAQDTLIGTVTHVRDGDTIVVGDQPVRLSGLHAAERNEPGGSAATTFMTDLVLGETVRCDVNCSRTHNRLVGVCFLDGDDIARLLVQVGLGWDCPRYSGGRYAADEQAEASAFALPSYCD